MVVRDDFEPAFSDSISSLLAHISAVHIPLGFQQRLHNVLGTADREHAQWGLKEAQTKTTHVQLVHKFYLQTGTTIGLSLISLNWPLSLRA